MISAALYKIRSGIPQWDTRRGRQLIAVSLAVLVLSAKFLFDTWTQHKNALVIFEAAQDEHLEIQRLASIYRSKKVEGAGAELGKSTVRNESLVELVATSASGQGISIQDLSSQDPYSASMTATEVNFEKFLRWIYKVETQYGLVAKNVRVSKSKKAGLVDVLVGVSVSHALQRSENK